MGLVSEASLVNKGCPGMGNRLLMVAPVVGSPKVRSGIRGVIPPCKGKDAFIFHPYLDSSASEVLVVRRSELVARHVDLAALGEVKRRVVKDRKSTRLNSSHQLISYAVF